MKTSNPYGPGMSVKVPPENINNELSKAGSKAKARYPHTPLGINVSGSGNAGKMKRPAMTPGTTPTGS